MGPSRNRLEPPQDAPLPGEWWKQVPPEQRDWWANRLNSVPFAGGSPGPRPYWPNQLDAFQGEGDLAPNQHVTQEWLMRQDMQNLPPLRYR